MMTLDEVEEVIACKQLFIDHGHAPQKVFIRDGAFVWTYTDGHATGTIKEIHVHGDRAHPMWQLFAEFKCGSIDYTWHGEHIAIVTYILDEPIGRYVIMGLDSDKVRIYTLDELRHNVEWVAPRAFAWRDLKDAFHRFFCFI